MKLYKAVSAQLKLGIKHEAEHTGTFKKIKAFVDKNKKWPSMEQMQRWTAEDHLKKMKDYYTRLEHMEHEAEEGEDED